MCYVFYVIFITALDIQFYVPFGRIAWGFFFKSWIKNIFIIFSNALARNSVDEDRRTGTDEVTDCIWYHFGKGDQCRQIEIGPRRFPTCLWRMAPIRTFAVRLWAIVRSVQHSFGLFARRRDPQQSAGQEHWRGGLQNSALHIARGIARTLFRRMVKTCLITNNCARHCTMTLWLCVIACVGILKHTNSICRRWNASNILRVQNAVTVCRN